MVAKDWAFAICVTVGLAGCFGGSDDDEGPEPPEEYEVPAGIVYRDPEGHLAALDDETEEFPLQSGGFDIAGGILAAGDNQRSINTWHEDDARSVDIDGAYNIARVSLSPDGTQAVFQAAENPGPPHPQDNDLHIYVADLETGESRRLSPPSETPINEESPEWSPAGGLIAYSSFSPETGIDLHIVEAETGVLVRLIEDAGGLHTSFSRDGQRILETSQLRIYNVLTGALVSDLRDEAIAAAEAEGYDLETGFPGQANRGTFPMDGDFSPDGDQILFDGAILDEGKPKVLIMRMDIDGTGFEVLAGPFEVEPDETNGLNYSELNPMWV